MTQKIEISNSDRAVANLIIARDAIATGKLLRANSAITAALMLLDKKDPESIDSEVLRLLAGGAK